MSINEYRHDPALGSEPEEPTSVEEPWRCPTCKVHKGWLHSKACSVDLIGKRFGDPVTTEPNKPTSGTQAHSILTEAAEITLGARNATHGDKERSFEAIAGLWNAYTASRKSGGPLTARDVAIMMALLKIARSVQGEPVRDHFVDMAGYAAIAGELL